jgi:hypothetical protein
MRFCAFLLGILLMPAAPTLHSQDFHSPIILSPYAVAMGEVQVGTKSASQPVTVLNTGTNVVHIIGLVVTGNFSQTNDCPLPPAGLGHNETCTIQVFFEPKEVGAASATLTITDDVPGVGSLTVMLSGTGTLGTPQVMISPRSLRFDVQTLGSTGAPQTAMVSNSGKRAVQIANITVSGDFTIMPSSTCNTLGQTLAPGASCTIVVTFTPLEPGERNGEAIIRDDAEDSPQKIVLSGGGK